MDIEITLKNYRCFREVRWVLSPGIHAFVGLNNVGKSAFTRLIYELRPILRELCSVPSRGFGNKAIASQLAGPAGDVPAVDVVRTKVRNGAAARFELKGPLPPGAVSCVEIHVDPLGGVSAHYPSIPAPAPEARPSWEDSGFTLVLSRNGQREEHFFAALVTALGELADSVYLPAIRASATGAASGHRWYDLRVGSALVEGMRGEKTSKDRRIVDRFRAMERTLASILGFKSLQIEPIPERHEFDVVIDEVTRRLDEVGSGIAQFLIAATIAAVRSPSYLMIDEPESNLHPALQERFLSLLMANTKKAVLFSTHSLGLARTVTDSIWLVSRDTEGCSRIGRLSTDQSPVDILGDLQYSAWRFVGLRQILLVEGPSDVLMIRHWLRALGRELEFLVLPIGGHAMNHEGTKSSLRHLKTLPTPVAAPVDSERVAEGADAAPPRIEFQATCRELGIPCHFTERRALENYLTKAALDRGFPEANFAEPGHFDDPIEVPWRKPNSWRAAQHMTKEEILETDVGRFLDRLPTPKTGRADDAQAKAPSA